MKHEEIFSSLDKDNSPITSIKDYNGDIIDFDRSRIERSIEKSLERLGEKDEELVISVTDQVIRLLQVKLSKLDDQGFLTISDIEETVEKSLALSGNYQLVKDYILNCYRKKISRERKKSRADKKVENNTLKITKNNGEKELFSIEKVRNTYKRVSYGLARKCPFEQIEESLKKYLVEGIKTSEITKMLIKSAIDLVSTSNTEWQFIAGRLALLDLYKEASKNRGMEVSKIYEPKHYLALIKDYVERGLYWKEFLNVYSEEDILKAGKELNKSTDFTYNHQTVLMYRKRYLLNPNKVIKELPQEMYMSVALFLASCEKSEDRLDVAFKIYKYCSTGAISLPTPTLLNSRTNFHQLSSCFKLNIGDDLRAIYHGIENMAQISKFGGGIGVYLGHIRSRGGSIRGVKGVSTGVNPWIKVINDTAVAVNQLGCVSGDSDLEVLTGVKIDGKEYSLEDKITINSKEYKVSDYITKGELIG